MTTMLDTKAEELRQLLIDEETLSELDDVAGRVLDKDGNKKYTLADAIREGARVSDQAYAWGDGAQACALTAAVLAARARRIEGF